MRIAIIGAGISGLSAAYKLHRHHEVVIYDREAWMGGHARTVDVTLDGKVIPVDIGVNVFSGHDYPILMKLFADLEVPLKECDMSFGVSADTGAFEWSNEVSFGHLRLLFSLRFYRMVYDALRFFRYAKTRPVSADWTLKQLFDEWRIGPIFRNCFLLPMASAIYTCPPQILLRFSALKFMTFFKQHGLLEVFNLPTWYNIPGGCREYLKRLVAPFESSIYLNTEVMAVTRQGRQVKVTLSGQRHEVFDQVVMACHPATALKLLGDADATEKQALGAITYAGNDLYVHTDTSVAPQNQSFWASWMYALRQSPAGTASAITYWVNKLQGRFDCPPLFITLNPLTPIDEKHVLHRQFFEHPVFDLAAVKAQQEVGLLQGVRNTWYCGAYLGHGFHEDGCSSGFMVAEKLLANGQG